ncbi:MAG TPA: orotidine-5'-phosphate decarboxylase [Polyangiaceae bacterium]|nr:orotidine-5'-phosphate decarboxylase [Polyangiaceae bacterium]
MKPQDRIIVALDVPTRAEALRLVDELDGLVSFYKIGLELLLGGGLQDLMARLGDKSIFVDLKLPDDIPATIGNVVRLAAEMGVKLLTLSHSVGEATIRAAVGARGARPGPELLWVPVLSSMDSSDFARQTGGDPAEFHADLVRRAKWAKSTGTDGFIVSGQEIALLRAEFPKVTLVSPGIRPAWASGDDHKRVCTPAEALRLGADYIVVGRPIRNAGDREARRAAAQRIIDELSI